MKESFNSCVSFEDLEKEQIYLHILNQKNYHLLSEIILFNQVSHRLLGMEEICPARLD